MKIVKVNNSVYFNISCNQSKFSDTKVALHVLLLPLLIPPKSRTKITVKQHWKFSSSEVSESLLMHVKVRKLFLFTIFIYAYNYCKRTTDSLSTLCTQF